MQIIHTVKSFQHRHFASFEKRFTFVFNSSAGQKNTLAPYMVKKTEKSAAKNQRKCAELNYQS